MRVTNDSKFIDSTNQGNFPNATSAIGKTKNTRVKINGKKVFINIQSFYKETKNRNKKYQAQMNSQQKIRHSSINKENVLEKNNRNSFYQTKNYLKYNSINSGKKNRQNLTGHANILLNKKHKGSAHKLRVSEDKRRYNAIRTSADVSRDFVKMNSRRKIIRKY
jgi:hypothetical protein